MIELAQLYKFVDTTLRNNAPFMTAVPGGLWRAKKTDLVTGVFPETIWCVYQWMGGHDDVGGGGFRIASNDLLLIKVIGPGDNLAAIETAADLMDGLIHQASGVTSTATIYFLLREQSFTLEESINGRLVTHLGGQYRAVTQRIGT